MHHSTTYPFVSVIIPNYNHAPFLVERIESVLSQTYPNIEVLLLDDASTDDSISIMKRYEHHPAVRLIHVNEHNTGSAFLQWQAGIHRATGEYIWIAESDDVASPLLLETLVGRLEKDESVLAFCHSEWIDEKGTPIWRRQTDYWKRDFTLAGKAFIRKHLLGYSRICNASAVVFRKQAAKQVGDMFTRYQASGDRQFWIEICLQGNVSYVAQPLNKFRQHEHKVSPEAARKGINIQEDHAIYQAIAPQLALSTCEKRSICGYHYHAIASQAHMTPEGKAAATVAWKAEKEYSKLSHLCYQWERIRDILGWH